MKLKNMFYGFIASATIFTTGCSTMAMQQYEGVNAQQHFILQKALSIAPGSTRVFIQNGHSMSGSGFNRSEQHCRIEVKNLSETKQTIQPDQFAITSIQIDEEMIALNSRNTIQLVANSYQQTQTDIAPANYLTLAGISQERVATMDLIHLNLYSKKQNNVMRLTCAGALSDGDMADAPRSYRPGLKQINLILGEIGKIE